MNDLDFSMEVFGRMKELSRTGNYALLDLQPIAFACTSSFFLNWRSIEKYAGFINNEWKLGWPIDLFIRELVKRQLLKAYVTVPFQTSVSRDTLQSDIRGQLDRTRAVCTAYRRAFFQDADLQSLDAEIQELVNGATLSPLAAIYAKALRFNLSDEWGHF